MQWMVKHLVVGMLLWSAAVQAQTSATETTQAYESYPPVHYRGSEFMGHHCVQENAKASVRELFLLKTTLDMLARGRNVAIDVSEFFSGRQYVAILEGGRDYRISLTVNGVRKNLDCQVQPWVLMKKAYPIDASGDFLHLERIGATGQYGDFDLNNKCDAGESGWVDCDIGTFGFSRRSADGKVRWARLIAVSVQTEGGHPLYKLSRALRVIDQFDFATLLNDGTAVLTFYGLMSIRIDMNRGALLEPRSDVAVVPLQDWAELKRITNERWHGSTRPCKSSDMNCEQRLTEMYIYTLQNYLFPLK